MAERDRSQGVSFVYTNIYEIYKKAKAAGTAHHITGQAAVAEPLRTDVLVPDAETGQKVKAVRLSAAALRVLPSQSPVASKAFEDLRGNLKSLHEMHAKLRFMLQELEALVKDKKKDES
jgi:hypothetical protein